ncbi:hypothetical protein GCM10028805_60180 [Spirosoma harenae]
MKTILLFWLSLCALPAFAQPLETVTLSSTGVKKVVRRDTLIYPRNPAGNSAFLQAVNTGTLVTKPLPSEGSIVGRYSYSFFDSRKDWLNHNVVSSVAPVLADGPRTVPRLTGNYYSFAPQTALNTISWNRFPQFNAHSSKVIIYPGGLYSNTSDNGFLSRGWTHVAESAKWDVDQPYPTQYRRALEMANYQAAYNAAQSLDSGDPRKQQLLDWAGPLPAFEGTHVLISNEEAAKLYAQYWYNTFKQADWAGAGVDYFSVNHEVYSERSGTGLTAYQQWYRQVGWITKEINRLAALEGKFMPSGLTDHGNLAHPAPYFFEGFNATIGLPEYYEVDKIQEPFRGSSQSAPMGAPSDLGAMVRDGKAFTGVGSYVQHTFDDHSLYKKNSNGSYKLDSLGGLIWNDSVRTATITGQSAVIYNQDAFQSQLKFYGMYARFCANQYFRAGGVHLPRSDIRQPGFENVRFSSQFRLDTEVTSGMSPESTGLTEEQFATLNSRPLNPDWTEGHAIAMYLFTDYIRGWMETQPKSALGSNNGGKSRASAEIYTKGFHRASQLNWIFSTPWTLIQPKFWIFKQGITSGPDADEQFYRKPILVGGLATKDGKPTIWINGWWPSQDVNKYTDVVIWIDKGAGQKSPGYRIRLKGRKPFLEYWQLPDAMAGAQPKDVYFQFRTLLGELVTWRGDYREAKITSHPTPPTVVESELNGGTVTDPGSQTTSAPSWIAGMRYTYNPPLLTFEGAGQIGQIKFERQDGTTFWTTNPDNVTVNSGTFYSPGPLDGQSPYDKQWKLYWHAAYPIVATLQQAGTSATYSYTVTPVSGANRVILTGGTSVTVTDPGSGGGTVTMGTPLAGAFDYHEFSPSSIPSSYSIGQSNGQAKLVLNLKEGYGTSNGLAGGIQSLIDLSTGINVVSNPMFKAGQCDDCGHPIPSFDLGSGLTPVGYRGPAPWSFLPDVRPDLPGLQNIGDNFLEMGSSHGASSHLEALGTGTINGSSALFTKVDAAQWDGDTQSDNLGLRLGDKIKSWRALEGNVLKFWHEFSLNRTSANGGDNWQDSPIQQETPALYANGLLGTTVFYDGDAPYTNSPTRQLDGSNWPDDSGFRPGEWFLTEPWIAVIDPATGKGAGLIFETPITNIGQFNGRYNVADGTGFGRNYISWQPKMILDRNITWRFSGLTVLGTVDQIRAKAYEYTQSRYQSTPEYRFNQSGRQLWSMSKCLDPGYQTSRTSWPVTFKSSESSIISPAGAWQGSNKHVYVKYRYTAYNRSNPTLKLCWRRARQANFPSNESWFLTKYPDGAGYGDQYQLPLTLIADGQWHIAHFDLSSKPEWKQIINEFYFSVDGSAAINETIDIEWVSASSNGPAN